MLLGEGKVAGILLEMTAETDRVERVVAGVGLNVRRPAHDAFEGAAYLSDGGLGVRTPVVAGAVLDGIAAAYASWCTGGFAALRDAYAARFALAGCEVSVRDLRGMVRARGVAVGVDDGGRLLVEESGQVTPVTAGEVTLR